MSDSVTAWTAACQASLSITNSCSLLKLMSIKSVMPSNHLILCHPLLPLPPVFPSIRIFSNESDLHIRWPKCWSFSFIISPCNEYFRLISFRIDSFILPTVQGTCMWKWKSLSRVQLFATPWTIQSWNSPGQKTGVGSLSLLQGIFPTHGSNWATREAQYYSSKTSVLQCSTFFMVQLSHLYMTIGKTIALTIQTFASKVTSLLFITLSRFVITFLPRRSIF